jgi:hypothetical protein
MNYILNECNVTATLLVSLLEDLKVRDTASMGSRIARIFRSAQQAVRTVVNQSQIDDLNEKMKKLRNDIQGYNLTVLQ